MGNDKILVVEVFRVSPMKRAASQPDSVLGSVNNRYFRPCMQRNSNLLHISTSTWMMHEVTANHTQTHSHNSDSMWAYLVNRSFQPIALLNVDMG